MLTVGVIGPGLVGRALLQQLEQHVAQSGDVKIKVLGVINSKKMLLATESPKDLLSAWDSATETSSMEKFENHLVSHQPSVVVDCTSNPDIAGKYTSWMNKGLHIVTPNKKAFSSELSLFDELMSHKKTMIYHEATVGAGLPIISTLKGLLRTGDEILKIEGIFSGTMSYLFNTFSSPTPPKEKLLFSNAVQVAKDSGFTEPDPRDDLNGMDVARKTVILGRLSGGRLTLEDLPIQNIVPEELRGCASAEEFMKRLPEFDGYFADLNDKAFKEGKVLRYVGVVELNGQSVVELRSFPFDHPFANLKGSDNIISFTTKRYANPLIVQGAGAGADVTAGGVFSDILTIADRL